MARYVLDPDHTAAGFRVRHMMVTWVSGQFNGVEGVLDFDPQDIGSMAVEATIYTAGIYTGVEKRDADLRSPNYLDVENYPTITFMSTGAEAVGLDSCLVYGQLTIHGVTRDVVLDVSVSGPSYFQDENRFYTTYGIHGETQIHREDFGMVTNLQIENNGFMVGKHIYLTIDAEADLSEE